MMQKVAQISIHLKNIVLCFPLSANSVTDLATYLATAIICETYKPWGVKKVAGILQQMSKVPSTGFLEIDYYLG